MNTPPKRPYKAPTLIEYTAHDLGLTRGPDGHYDAPPSAAALESARGRR